MMKKGMITFGGLGDYRNAIVLCGGCHNHYDRTSNMGWVFLPAGMEWFAEWELADFARREQIFAQTGRETERTYPTEEDFEKHLRTIGTLSDPDDGMCRGGLYHSYILEDMFAPIMMSALKRQGMSIPGRFPGGPKRWHGAPMAAINRGFVVTGSPEMELPEKEWELLRTLQRLYSRKLSNPAESEVTSSCTDYEIAPLENLHQGHGTRTTRRQQGGPTQAEKESTTANQQSSSGLGDTSAQDVPTESAIDVTSEDGRRRRCLGAGGTRDDRYSGVKPESSDHKRTHEEVCATRDDFAEEELGLNPESWCFGPASSSVHKINMHIGKRRCVEISVSGIDQVEELLGIQTV